MGILVDVLADHILGGWRTSSCLHHQCIDVGVDVGPNGNHDIPEMKHSLDLPSKEKKKKKGHSRSNQEEPLKVIGLAILNDTIHHDDSQREDGRFKGVEMQRHGLIHDPAHDDHERGDKQGDLQGAAGRSPDPACPPWTRSQW